jgi:hypothetical protein
MLAIAELVICGRPTILLLSSTSILLPITTCPDQPCSIPHIMSHTNGKLSGSIGLAWTRNSSRQLSSVSKLFELLTSYTSTQQSAPR